MNLNATILGQSLSFILFIWLGMKYIWIPLMTVIEKRQQKIANDLDMIKKSTMESERVNSEALVCLQQARIKAQEIVKHAYARKLKILIEAQKEAQKERDSILFDTKMQIAQERKRVSNELMNQMSQFIVESIEKIMNKSINDDIDYNFINKVIKTLSLGDGD